MRAMCRAEGGDRLLTTVVDAPVQYDSREFILHLFAKLCSEVLGSRAVRRLRAGGFNTLEARSGGAPFNGPPAQVVGLALFAAGSLVGLLQFLNLSSAWGRLLVGAGIALVGYLLFFWSVVERRRRRRVSDEATSAAAAEQDAEATAELRLRQIWFQQSYSSGWSGSLTLPAGVEAGATGGRELSEEQLSLPDIVDLLRKFLAIVIGSGSQVRIGIDELDKMDDETAHRFLNEIKVTFRVPGCFFLVSISEDAMSAFERRGLPIRDVFDSSFDDVQYVPHLDFESSRALLARRVVDLPPPFVALLHCISGGLPRDLIRSTRELTALGTDVPLADAADRLLRDALKRKSDAAKVAARTLDSDEAATTLTRWLSGMDSAGADPTKLLDACRRFERELLWPLGRLRQEGASAAGDARRIGTQTLVFAYFVATLSQFVTKLGERGFVLWALGQSETAGPEPALVDRLATIPQTFASDLSAAWESTSSVRSELDLTAIPFPVEGEARRSRRLQSNGRLSSARS